MPFPQYRTLVRKLQPFSIFDPVRVVSYLFMCFTIHMASLIQIEGYLREETAWAQRAADLDGQQRDMREVARRLSEELTPLNNLFLPIRELHNTSTWEGNAATQSRTRLDGYENQYEAAVRSINGLIDSLNSRAGELYAEEQSAYGSVRYFRTLKENAMEDFAELTAGV